MDKEQNLDVKERLYYVQEVAQEARDRIAGLFMEKGLTIKEVVWALAGICGAMTDEVSEQSDTSKEETGNKFIHYYKTYLSCE